MKLKKNIQNKIYIAIKNLKTKFDIISKWHFSQLLEND